MPQKAFQISFSGAAVEQAFYGDVLMLRVEENTGSANAFQLQMQSTLGSDGSWSYMDDSRFGLFTPVSIRMGFSSGSGLSGALGAAANALGIGASGGGGNDGLVPIFDGYVTAAHFESGSAPGSSTFEIAGLDTSVLMSVEEKVAVFNNMSDSDIAQQILGSYGVTVQADSTATVHQEEETSLVQRTSDARFLRELAQRNGLEFYLETDPTTNEVTAYFQAPQLGGTPQTDLALQFGDKSNLLQFSAHVTGQRPLAVKVSQVDIEADSATTAQVTDTRLAKIGASDANDLIGSALAGLVTPSDTQAQMLILGPPTSDATEQQTIAQAVRDDAGWLIAASGEVNSDAYGNVLRPHRTVLVKGAGKTYSGMYYVTHVTHEMRGDGTYSQKFKARRNALGVDGTEQFGSSGLGLPIPGM